MGISGGSDERHHSLLDQAYAAGVAEGEATRELVYMSLLNTVDGYCDGAEEFCQKLAIFLLKNYVWMTEQIKLYPNDTYWQHVGLTLTQLQGLIDGYEKQKIRPNDLTIHPIYMLQLMGDHSELEIKFHRPQTVGSVKRSREHCSALIKPTANNADLLVSHVTWTSYSSMLRLQKVYKFGGESFPGHTKSMSGYPGTLASIDDFVILSSGMIVTETTIENHNPDLYKYVIPQTLLTWIRSQVAHRLANDGRSWVQTFSKFNSGTYNNQWMIVDYKKLQPGRPLPSTGLFYVLEQMPGTVEYADFSAVLKKQGYWPSFNRAYFAKIFNMSGSWEMVERFGSYYTYDMAPRAQIFRRDQNNVVDMDTLQHFMRSNDYQHDPISRCECQPPFSASSAISARGDLNPENGSFLIADLGFIDMGATDMKASNRALMKKLQFRAIAGPTSDSVPVFSWKTTPLKDIVKHVGHPDEWRFPPIVHEWSTDAVSREGGDRRLFKQKKSHRSRSGN